jgi:acetolactate synthase-1/2/3 large subunit
VLRERVPPGVVLDEFLAAEAPRLIYPDPAKSRARPRSCRGEAAARDLGRGAMGNATELVRFLDASGALYLDTQESRGLVPAAHASYVAPCGRGR